MSLRTTSRQDWDDLVNKLRSDFLPSTYEEDLWNQIKARRQTIDEKPTMYIATMINFFNRLINKPDSDTQIRQIFRNLHPYYSSSLALERFETIHDLSSLCKKLEEVKIQNARFRSADQPASTSVERPSRRRSSDRNINEIKPSNTGLRCWCCKQTGHSCMNCPDNPDKKFFCFKCGKPGVTTPRCPKCQGNGRGREGQP